MIGQACIEWELIMIQKTMMAIGLNFILIMGSGRTLINPTNPYSAVAPGRQNFPEAQALLQNDSYNLTNGNI